MWAGGAVRSTGAQKSPPRSTRRCRRERRRRWDGRAVQLVLRAAAPAGAAVHRHLSSAAAMDNSQRLAESCAIARGRARTCWRAWRSACSRRPDEEKQRREEVDRRCGKMQASLRGHFSSILLAVCSLSCSLLLTVLLTF